MQSRKSAHSMFNPGYGVSLTATLLGLMLLSVIFGGCAAKRTVLYPLENDFHRADGGWFMSDFYLCNVMGVDVEGVNCGEVKTHE